MFVVPLELVKQIHVGLAGLTILSFTGRGVLMLRGSGLLRAKWLRITPHVIDTLLLFSGLALALSLFGTGFYRQPWLAAKLLAVVAYIFLGRLALKTGRSRTRRGLACAGSLLLLAYIVAVAVSKSPLPL